MAPIRVALVDDVDEMRLLVGLSLTLSGDFEVVGEASNGREAISLAEEQRPELMLLDLSMPEMDGFEALPRVLAASPDTCVVVFSGFDEGQHSGRARELGAAGYIEKGTSMEELAPRLRAYVDAAKGPLQSGS